MKFGQIDEDNIIFFLKTPDQPLFLVISIVVNLIVSHWYVKQDKFQMVYVKLDET